MQISMDRDSIDFALQPVPLLFHRLLVPTLLGMVFNMAFILTDGIFVGHGVGPEGLAAINLVGPLMMLITGTGLMFGIGSTVVAAIHLSHNNVKAARINVTQAYIASTVISFLMCGLFILFSSPILLLLGVTPDLMPYARSYFDFFIPTCIFLMFQIVGEFVIRLDGSPKFAMYANIIPAVVNIILDYTFVIPLGWGLRGAALATDFGTSIGAFMTLYYMFFKSRTLRFYRLKHTFKSLRLSLRNVSYMVHTGASAFIGEFSIAMMMMVGNIAFGRWIGDDGIAAYSVICYLFPVVYMVCNAIAQSAQPMMSYDYGAKRPSRVRSAFLLSLFYSIAFGLVMTLVFVIFPSLVISVFLDAGSSAYSLAVEGLPLYAISLIPVAFNVAAIFYFQSVGHPSFSTLLMLLRGVIVMVPAFLLFPNLLASSLSEVIVLWMAIPVAEVVTSVVALVRFATSY